MTLNKRRANACGTSLSPTAIGIFPVRTTWPVGVNTGVRGMWRGEA